MAQDEYKCSKCGAQADERWDCCEVTSLRDAIMKLPRRLEPISGQTFAYVKLEDVVALVEQHTREASRGSPTV